MCCDGSDPLALLRAFSGVLARVNNRKLTRNGFREFRTLRNFHLQAIRDGPGRNRTCDLGIKSPLLYQLSYRPFSLQIGTFCLDRIYQSCYVSFFR
jgi:hypothetical protein